MESAALARFTGYRNRPAVLFSYSLADEQPQAHARESLIIDIAAPVEALEYVAEVFFGYTDSAVGDCQVIPAIIVPQFYTHRPALRTVFHGIFYQVLYQLQNADRIVLPNHAPIALQHAGVALRIMPLAALPR